MHIWNEHMLSILNSDPRRAIQNVTVSVRCEMCYASTVSADKVATRARRFRKSKQPTNIFPTNYVKQDNPCTSNVPLWPVRVTVLVRKTQQRSACIIDLRVTVTVNRQKQDCLCRYNVKLKCFRVTVVELEKQSLLHILSVFL
jgi:hypothetical protein